MLRTALVALGLTLAPQGAWAEAWVVDPDRSEILFDYTRAGQQDQGAFERFVGEGFFNAKDLGSAALEIRIKSRSIDLRDTLASAFATSAEWFDAKNHPYVTYQLDRLEETEEGSYQATGRLSIRGRERIVTSPLRLDFSDGSARAEGAITVDRRDYLLGVGPSAAFVTIGPDVTVRFRLEATQAE